MTSIDFILEEIRDEKIKKIAKLAYSLGVQDTINLQTSKAGWADDISTEYLNDGRN